jgi:CBS domain-containing membrane protein
MGLDWAAFGSWIGLQPASGSGRILAGALGRAFGILVTGAVMRMWLGDSSGLPLLVAPMGASAVLLFAVPASPLAQPWAIIGGNVVSALCGIFWMRWLGSPAYAACLAVASAIAAMSLARCLHPPGGACALTCVIGGKAVVAAGWSFALLPVGVNSLLLVGLGLLFNAGMRGNYPHRATQFVAQTPEPAGYNAADIEAVLAQYEDLLDVSREDLDTLFRQVEGRAFRRLHGVIRCQQLMRQPTITLCPHDSMEQARHAFSVSGQHVLPVLDDAGHLEGMLAIGQMLLVPDGEVGAVMDRSPCMASPDTPVDELLPILSGGVYHDAAIVGDDGQWLGLVTQSDLLSALWRGQVAADAGSVGASLPLR